MFSDENPVQVNVPGSEPRVLRRLTLLDPRPADEAYRRPFHAAVNIPLEELARRTYELPPRHEVVRVASVGDVSARCVRWLCDHGRRAELATAVTAAPQVAEEPGRLWEPASLLLPAVEQLRPGQALDLACGTGRNAVFLAAAGWSVTAIDVLPDALDRGAELARRYGVSERITWLKTDLRSDPLSGLGQFQLVCVVRYFDRRLAARITERLAPGGSLICECYTPTHRARHGRPGQADVVTVAELRESLPPLSLKVCDEGWRGVEHLVRLWGVKEGDDGGYRS